VLSVFGSDGNYFDPNNQHIESQVENNETMNNPREDEVDSLVETSHQNNLHWEAAIKSMNMCLSAHPDFSIYNEGIDIASNRAKQQKRFELNQNEKLCNDPNHYCSKVEFCSELSTLRPWSVFQLSTGFFSINRFILQKPIYG
jgi:hypothetical protein